MQSIRYSQLTGLHPALAARKHYTQRIARQSRVQTLKTMASILTVIICYIVAETITKG